MKRETNGGVHKYFPSKGKLTRWERKPLLQWANDGVESEQQKNDANGFVVQTKALPTLSLSLEKEHSVCCFALLKLLCEKVLLH